MALKKDKKSTVKKQILKKPKIKKETTKNKVSPKLKKRKRAKKGDTYFGKIEEEAVVRYLSCTNEREKNEIYITLLKYPFERMVELIIKKYKLYRQNMTINEQIDDTISFLFTKAAKFEPAQNKKAYSYYGTISKNYNLGLVQKERKILTITTPYEENHEELEEREDLSYIIDDDTTTLSFDKLINKMIISIQKELDNDKLLTNRKKITDNEKKVGSALINLLNNWESLIQTIDGNNKFNKISILQTMRNLTNLTTKDIRLSMKRYKDMFFILKQIGLDDE